MATQQELSEIRQQSGVGFVETKLVTLFESPPYLKLSGGGELGPIQVAYETYGTLTPAKDNAIYICHALTGDAHAAGYYEDDDEKAKPGWWDDLIGPGRTLDTDKYFVICANVLGGCQGTTGPGSINPQTGQPYRLGFPVITVSDLVEVHSALTRHLGIDQLLAVIGGSLGGMQVLEWAAQFPDQLRSAICLATAAQLSAQGIAFNAVGRRAIKTDPEYKSGEYEKGAGPRYGLALARMIAHITYLSDQSIEMKFGRRLQDHDNYSYDSLPEVEFQVESYLHYQGKRFVERFDANSYLYLTRAMDYFDLEAQYGSLVKALKNTDARFLIASYDSDWLFTTTQSKELVRALIECGKHVSFIELKSPFGHDSFLIEIKQLQKMITPFLEQTYQSRLTASVQKP
ncbi:MAG: homoserine O-acetyltransferase [Gimesia sp.]|nr:homoserine O-acetyltransferase [Gimesia sp.]